MSQQELERQLAEAISEDLRTIRQRGLPNFGVAPDDGRFWARLH